VNKSKYEQFIETINDDELLVLKEWGETRYYGAVKTHVENMKIAIMDRALDSTTSSGNLYDFAELQGTYKAFKRMLSLPLVADKLLLKRKNERDKDESKPQEGTGEVGEIY
jgi:hypothetical protein